MLFIQLTQIYRAKPNDIGGRFFVNPKSIISMQTGFIAGGVKATALTLPLEGYIYVTESPEQIMELIEPEEEP